MSKQVNYDKIPNNIKSQYNEHNFVTIQEYARKKENKEQIIISARQYSINHKLPYIKVLADMKAENYATAFQNGNRWFIDSKESPKTKVRPYKRKKLTE